MSKPQLQLNPLAATDRKDAATINARISNPLVGATNLHNHAVDGINGYGGSLSQFGPGHPYFGLHDPAGTTPGNDWYLSFDGQATIPADDTELQLDSRVGFSKNYGIAGELGRIRAEIGYMKGGTAATPYNTPTGPLAQLNPAATQVGDINLDASSSVVAGVLASTATNAPPLSVLSDLMVANLNAQYLADSQSGAIHHGTIDYGVGNEGGILALNSLGYYDTGAVLHDADEAETFDALTADSSLVNTLNRIRSAPAATSAAAGLSGHYYDQPSSLITQVQVGDASIGKGPVSLHGGTGVLLSTEGNAVIFDLDPAVVGAAIVSGGFVGDPLNSFMQPFTQYGIQATSVSGTLPVAMATGVNVATGGAYVPGTGWKLHSTTDTLTSASVPPLAANSDNWIYFTGTGLGVDSVGIGGGASLPANSVLLAKVTTDSSNVTAITDERQLTAIFNEPIGSSQVVGGAGSNPVAKAQFTAVPGPTTGAPLTSIPTYTSSIPLDVGDQYTGSKGQVFHGVVNPQLGTTVWKPSSVRWVDAELEYGIVMDAFYAPGVPGATTTNYGLANPAATDNTAKVNAMLRHLFSLGLGGVRIYFRGMAWCAGQVIIPTNQLNVDPSSGTADNVMNTSVAGATGNPAKGFNVALCGNGITGQYGVLSRYPSGMGGLALSYDGLSGNAYLNDYSIVRGGELQIPVTSQMQMLSAASRVTVSGTTATLTDFAAIPGNLTNGATVWLSGHASAAVKTATVSGISYARAVYPAQPTVTLSSASDGYTIMTWGNNKLQIPAPKGYHLNQTKDASSLIDFTTLSAWGTAQGVGTTPAGTLSCTGSAGNDVIITLDQDSILACSNSTRYKSSLAAQLLQVDMGGPSDPNPGRIYITDSAVWINTVTGHKTYATAAQNLAALPSATLYIDSVGGIPLSGAGTVQTIANGLQHFTYTGVDTVNNALTGVSVGVGTAAASAPLSLNTAATVGGPGVGAPPPFAMAGNYSTTIRLGQFVVMYGQIVSVRPTMPVLGRLDTHGQGQFKLENFLICNVGNVGGITEDGSQIGVPFLKSTATQLDLENVMFAGSRPCTAPNYATPGLLYPYQDAIAVGGPGGYPGPVGNATHSASTTAYHCRFRGVKFDAIRTCLKMLTGANTAHWRDCYINGTCGGDRDHPAVEVLEGGGSTFESGLNETANYQVMFRGGAANAYLPSANWDSTLQGTIAAPSAGATSVVMNTMPKSGAGLTIGPLAVLGMELRIAQQAPGATQPGSAGTFDDMPWEVIRIKPQSAGGFAVGTIPGWDVTFLSTPSNPTNVSGYISATDSGHVIVGDVITFSDGETANITGNGWDGSGYLITWDSATSWNGVTSAPPPAGAKGTLNTGGGAAVITGYTSLYSPTQDALTLSDVSKLVPGGHFLASYGTTNQAYVQISSLWNGANPVVLTSTLPTGMGTAWVTNGATLTVAPWTLPLVSPMQNTYPSTVTAGYTTCYWRFYRGGAYGTTAFEGDAHNTVMHGLSADPISLMAIWDDNRGVQGKNTYPLDTTISIGRDSVRFPKQVRMPLGLIAKGPINQRSSQALIHLGDGLCDGVTTEGGVMVAFNGSTTGTLIGANKLAGSTWDWLRFQQHGRDLFYISNVGNMHLYPMQTGTVTPGITASASKGIMNVGDGGFAGSTISPNFSGSANGTVYASNMLAGFIGNHFDYQTGGVSKISGGYDGSAIFKNKVTVGAGGASNPGLNIVPTSNVGAPTTGTHAKGDVSVDSAAAVFVCQIAGTPGTWVQLSTGGGGVGNTLSLPGSGSTTTLDVSKGAAAAVLIKGHAFTGPVLNQSGVGESILYLDSAGNELYAVDGYGRPRSRGQSTLPPTVQLMGGALPATGTWIKDPTNVPIVAQSAGTGSITSADITGWAAGAFVLIACTFVTATGETQLGPPSAYTIVATTDGLTVHQTETGGIAPTTTTPSSINWYVSTQANPTSNAPASFKLLGSSTYDTANHTFNTVTGGAAPTSNKSGSTTNPASCGLDTSLGVTASGNRGVITYTNTNAASSGGTSVLQISYSPAYPAAAVLTITPDSATAGRQPYISSLQTAFGRIGQVNAPASALTYRYVYTVTG